MNSDAANVHETRVRSYMTDLNGVMYHAAYFGVFDDARIEVFRRLGFTYEWMQAHSWTLVIRHVECDFRAPAFMDDVLTIAVSVPRLARVSLRICYDCCRGDTLLASGAVDYAFLDGTMRPVRLPEKMRQAIQAHSELAVR
jgi:acyl-CoA thioester hydrolase